MTDSTTKIKAAGNGGTTTDQHRAGSRGAPYGFARLRESEVYHLMGLVQSAPGRDRAPWSGRSTTRPATGWLDHNGSTEPLDSR